MKKFLIVMLLTMVAVFSQAEDRTTPLVGNTKFYDPQFGITVGGLSLRDSYGDVFNFGEASVYTPPFKFFDIETKDAEAKILVTDYNGGDTEIIAGNTFIQVAAKGITLAADPGVSGATSILNLMVFSNNEAALAGGLVAGNLYRTGGDPDVLCIVH